MPEEILVDKNLSDEEIYKSLLMQIESLIDPRDPSLSNLANFTAALKESFNKIIEDNFPNFLKYDQVTYQCSKHHKNYEKLKNNSKDTFINYLKEVKTFLDVKEDVKDYGDLCRAAFKTKEIAISNMLKQLKLTENGIKIIEDDPSILSLPTGKKIIVKALRKGFEATKKEFIEAIDDTYIE